MHTTIYSPENVIKYDNSDNELVTDIEDENHRIYKLEIPENLNQYQYLTICRKFTEEGYDHWTNFHWMSLTPCDGIVFKITCRDNLYIKDYLIYDDKELYEVEMNNEKSVLEIVSTNWLEKYTGFTMTISENKVEK